VYDPMQGISSFVLGKDRDVAVLIDHRNVCSAYVKAGNCHTAGCDVLIFKASPAGFWQKIFDEPVLGRVDKFDPVTC
jgi:hypothetical protein